MATIVNSDMIPFRKRGMYQALQNGIFGFGSICGASFGGSIADSIGWRWCFLVQVPISAIALVLGWIVVKNPVELRPSWKEMRDQVDFLGALLLVTGISVQLVGMSLGGNELPWSNVWVIGSLVGSFVLLAAFVWVESRTTAIPVVPLRQLYGRNPIAIQTANICAGTAAYAYLFMLPLFFQVVLLDTATKAGARLAIPSLATPVGGLIAGIVMSRWGKLIPLVRVGALLLAAGNALVTSLSFHDRTWKYMVFIFPANLGQGIIYPATLFTTLASFDHSGKPSEFLPIGLTSLTRPDHAVSASTVYLIRSLGTVWGVAISAAIVQNTLNRRLPDALDDIPHKEEIINSIRHSVTVLRSLPLDIQMKARLIYYDGIRYSFAASTGIATVAIIASLFAYNARLRNTH
ncbi:hypothetical protein SLS60_004179 [Paraconiothyrium brasiliense]|uniref:Major facilitator superfamily (MFS) profile domain-containing protein n=1 Tax=Paraconiothyrium brasiliense TaxID=300254 RepID=A0ABR3RQY0_9PLEO